MKVHNACMKNKLLTRFFMYSDGRLGQIPALKDLQTANQAFADLRQFFCEQMCSQPVKNTASIYDNAESSLRCIFGRGRDPNGMFLVWDLLHVDVVL